MASGPEVQDIPAAASKAPPPLRSIAESASAGFDAIYDDHAPLMRAIARRKFNIPDSDIDGLVHDVFASFLTSASRVKELRPYLVGGICNASRNYWRRRERDDSLFVEMDENAVCGADLQQTVSRNLTLNAALSRIGERCRNVLRRYYLESESTASIAEAIGTSPGNVIYILHTCRKRAREFLDQMSSQR
jgi:RNA polymerase sigma factor (sigma-70 family)